MDAEGLVPTDKEWAIGCTKKMTVVNPVVFIGKGSGSA
jgi:hypothetical protein